MLSNILAWTSSSTSSRNTTSPVLVFIPFTRPKGTCWQLQSGTHTHTHVVKSGDEKPWKMTQMCGLRSWSDIMNWSLINVWMNHGLYLMTAAACGGWSSNNVTFPSQQNQHHRTVYSQCVVLEQIMWLLAPVGPGVPHGGEDLEQLLEMGGLTFICLQKQIKWQRTDN